MTDYNQDHCHHDYAATFTEHGPMLNSQSSQTLVRLMTCTHCGHDISPDMRVAENRSKEVIEYFKDKK